MHNTAHHGCSARVLWNVVTISLKPGRPPPVPRQICLHRDGVRFQLPPDPLSEPIFAIFHRFGDTILSVSGVGSMANVCTVLTAFQPRLLVTVQFFLRPASGPTGARQIGATVDLQPLAPAGFAWSSHIVTMQMHTLEPLHSDEEDLDVEDSDDDENAIPRDGILVETLSSDEEGGGCVEDSVEGL